MKIDATRIRSQTMIRSRIWVTELLSKTKYENVNQLAAKVSPVKGAKIEFENYLKMMHKPQEHTLNNVEICVEGSRLVFDRGPEGVPLWEALFHPEISKIEPHVSFFEESLPENFDDDSRVGRLWLLIYTLGVYRKYLLESFSGKDCEPYISNCLVTIKEIVQNEFPDSSEIILAEFNAMDKFWLQSIKANLYNSAGRRISQK